MLASSLFLQVMRERAHLHAVHGTLDVDSHHIVNVLIRELGWIPRDASPSVVDDYVQPSKVRDCRLNRATHLCVVAVFFFFIREIEMHGKRDEVRTSALPPLLTFTRKPASSAREHDDHACAWPSFTR